MTDTHIPGCETSITTSESMSDKVYTVPAWPIRSYQYSFDGLPLELKVVKLYDEKSFGPFKSKEALRLACMHIRRNFSESDSTEVFEQLKEANPEAFPKSFEEILHNM